MITDNSHFDIFGISRECGLGLFNLELAGRLQAAIVQALPLDRVRTVLPVSTEDSCLREKPKGPGSEVFGHQFRIRRRHLPKCHTAQLEIGLHRERHVGARLRRSPQHPHHVRRWQRRGDLSHFRKESIPNVIGSIVRAFRIEQDLRPPLTAHRFR
jgi:hypothetical protein